MTSDMLLAQIRLADGWLPVIFFVIAFIGWIANLFNSSQVPQRPARPVRPEGKKRNREDVQQEIDDFLNQSRRGQRPGDVEVLPDESTRRSPAPAAPQRRPPAADQRRSRKDVWEEQVGKRRERAERKQQQKAAKAQAASKVIRPGEGVTGRTALPQMSPGATSTAASRPVTSLQPQVGQSIASHLGSFRADDPQSTGRQGQAATTRQRDTAAAQIRRLMKSRQGVRQAVLLQEVLQRPLALRQTR